MKEIYIVDGSRTAFAKFGGSFVNTSATELGHFSAVETMKRSQIDPAQIDHVIFGNVIQSEKHAAYISRHIALRSGIGLETPALTINRLCGSGLEAVINAAQQITVGDADIVLAGGTENMSQAPYSSFTQRSGGSKMGNLLFEDMLLNSLHDPYVGIGMGNTAENLAEQYQITREAQDLFAVESHVKAAAARVKGIFTEEIVPVEVKVKKETKVVQEDEHIKPDSTVDSLSKLRTSFKKDGTVTAGNASGINDGAASVIVAGQKAVADHNLRPISKIRSWAVVGVEPSIMGIGPAPAIEKALQRAGLTLADMDVIEVNEAFAAQYLAVEKALGLNREKTNVNGGAIALGHPLGASGTRVLLTLAYELRRKNKRYGVAALCIGGGQGIAVVLENVS